MLVPSQSTDALGVELVALAVVVGGLLAAVAAVYGGLVQAWVLLIEILR